jgi:DhnA family fructose-bisphosphate aldolase class Ia
MAIDFEQLREDRAKNPRKIAQLLAARTRRPLLRGDDRLLIIAADHPARGAIAVADDLSAMADRYVLLERTVTALSRPGVDGVLGTPDIIDDLALLGVLDDKIVVGSMNRGGLRNASFEMDDRYTAYDSPSIKRDGLDFAKNLIRINLKDGATVATLEASARAVDQAAEAGIPIMLEPFISEWVDGKIKNNLATDAVVLSIAIASGLGNSSSVSWLKLPIVEEMERVVAATTLPILLLGGDTDKDQKKAFESWARALSLPGVYGLVVGRSLLYPHDGNVTAAVDAAVALVHGQ